MGARAGRVLVATAGVPALAHRLRDLDQAAATCSSKVRHHPIDLPPPAASADAQADPTTTGTHRRTRRRGDPPLDAVPKGLLGKDPNDDLSLGKKYFRAANFGLAETHFRRAVELHPRDPEAWVGLAASYDRLRRFDLADRAYDQAMKIVGPTPEILNNKGYSYMLRGDYAPRPRDLAARPRPRTRAIPTSRTISSCSR